MGYYGYYIYIYIFLEGSPSLASIASTTTRRMPILKALSVDAKQYLPASCVHLRPRCVHRTDAILGVDASEYAVDAKKWTQRPRHKSYPQTYPQTYPQANLLTDVPKCR